MASNSSKRNLLIRNTVCVVRHLQGLMADDATPEHVKQVLTACLELLDRGLMGQPLEDEHVQIEVFGGVAYVAEQTEYVQVTISDLDSEEG